MEGEENELPSQAKDGHAHWDLPVLALLDFSIASQAINISPSREYVKLRVK